MTDFVVDIPVQKRAQMKHGFEGTATEELARLHYLKVLAKKLLYHG